MPVCSDLRFRSFWQCALLAGIALVCPGAVPALLWAEEAAHWVDASAEAGLEFDHVNGASGRFHYIETYGSGVAFFDSDGDGDPDLYLVNSAPLPGFAAETPSTDRLYRNQGGHFADATSVSGLVHSGYGMGVAAGDWDNDGRMDLYLTNWGANRLLANGDDGVFADITQTVGVGDEGLGTSAAFADYDLDGDLDLYIANYARFDPQDGPVCQQGGVQVYCGPLHHQGVSGVLYRNDGDVFVDVTREVGVYSEEGRQLGVVFGDGDLDGDPDLYIANDAVPNFYFRNDGHIFRETGLLAGVAYNEDGEPEAGMGTDWADFDNDGLADLIVTNYQWEANRLYRNEGDGLFTDVSLDAGLAECTLPFLGFGVNFLDFDNDGWRDLFVANGHVDGNVQQYDGGARYAQRSLLLHNQAGRFSEIGARAGPGMALQLVGRGSAVADYDLDGDLDLCVTSNGGKAVLLRNQGRQGHWLGVRLQGIQSNRSGIGARVVIAASGGLQSGEVRSGSSYLSQSQLPLHFGLGAAQRVERLTVFWPSGRRQVLEGLDVDQVVHIVEDGG